MSCLLCRRFALLTAMFQDTATDTQLANSEPSQEMGGNGRLDSCKPPVLQCPLV